MKIVDLVNKLKELPEESEVKVWNPFSEGTDPIGQLVFDKKAKILELFVAQVK